jgi:FkbM family methyltransferase
MQPKNQILIYRVVDVALRILLRAAPYCSFTERLALWWGYHFRPSPGLVRLRSGATLCTNSVDHLPLLLRYLGTFEPHSLRAMRRCLNPGGTLLDVGANIGLFSIEAALIGANVIAIEAAPQHIEAIRSSISANGFNQIEVVSSAAWDRDGNGTLSLPLGANHGGFTLGHTAGDRLIEVPLRRIDGIVSDRQIDFIKIDIEGSEYRALVGAKDTIARCKPPILLELNEKALQACGSSSRAVKELLTSYGYRGHYLYGGNIGANDDHVCDECLFSPT